MASATDTLIQPEPTAPRTAEAAAFGAQRQRHHHLHRPRVALCPKRVALALLCVAQFMVVLDISIVNVALPSIHRDLHVSQASLEWVVNAYTLAFGGFLLLGGRAADLLGRRRVFLLGLAIFSAASLLGGLSGSIAMLIAARALQGVGSAIVAPATLSILTTTFAEGPERDHAMGVWAAVAAAGGAVGVLLGGALTSALGWTAVMFVNVPIGLAVILVAWHAIRPEPAIAKRHFDAIGALSVTAAQRRLGIGLRTNPGHTRRRPGPGDPGYRGSTASPPRFGRTSRDAPARRPGSHRRIHARVRRRRDPRFHRRGHNTARDPRPSLALPHARGTRARTGHHLTTDDAHPQENIMRTEKVTILSDGLKLAGDLRVPHDLSTEGDGRLPAVALTGPFSGVKDQVIGLYAQLLSEAGIVTLALDHCNFGESEGQPRQHENHGGKLADLRDAVSWLRARPNIDPDRVGLVGVCMGGGYVIKAAAFDPRVRAVAGIAGGYGSPNSWRARMGNDAYHARLANVMSTIQSE